MSPRKVCPNCRKLFRHAPGKNKPRCPDCQADHTREAERVRMSNPVEREVRNLRRSAAWQTVRSQCLERDNHTCRGIWRGEPCLATTNLDAHHVIPARELVARGGDPLELSNLVTLCRWCHSKADAERRRQSQGRPLDSWPRSI